MATLFADAKTGKNPVEHILGINRANHLAQLIDGRSDFHRNQFGMEFRVGHFKRLLQTSDDRLYVFTAAGRRAGDRKVPCDRSLGKPRPKPAAKLLNANSGMGTALNIEVGRRVWFPVRGQLIAFG